MKTPIAIDTGFLLSVINQADKNHPRAKEELARLDDEVLIVPAPVLVELFQLVASRIYYTHAIEVLGLIVRDYDIEPLSTVDYARMREIMAQYKDARFDFTDVAVMAVAERLNITRICTFDRRDFSVYRPTHCDHFTLLPE